MLYRRCNGVLRWTKREFRFEQPMMLICNVESLNNHLKLEQLVVLNNFEYV